MAYKLKTMNQLMGIDPIEAPAPAEDPFDLTQYEVSNEITPTDVIEEANDLPDGAGEAVSTMSLEGVGMSDEPRREAQILGEASKAVVRAWVNAPGLFIQMQEDLKEAKGFEDHPILGKIISDAAIKFNPVQEVLGQIGRVATGLESREFIEKYSSDPLREASEARWLKADPNVQPENFYEDVLMVGPQIVSSMGLTFINPALSIMSMGAQIMDSSYQNYVNDGVEPSRARYAAFANAVAQAPLEQLGLNKAMSLFKTRGAILSKLKDLMGVLGTEWGTEFIQAFPDSMAQIWAKNPDSEVLDHLEDFVDTLGETAAQGAKEGLTVLPWSLLGFGGSHIAQKLTEGKAKTREDARTAEMTELMELLDFDTISTHGEMADRVNQLYRPDTPTSRTGMSLADRVTKLYASHVEGAPSPGQAAKDRLTRNVLDLYNKENLSPRTAQVLGLFGDTNADTHELTRGIMDMYKNGIFSQEKTIGLLEGVESLYQSRLNQYNVALEDRQAAMQDSTSLIQDPFSPPRPGDLTRQVREIWTHPESIFLRNRMEAAPLDAKRLEIIRSLERGGAVMLDDDGNVMQFPGMTIEEVQQKLLPAPEKRTLIGHEAFLLVDEDTKPEPPTTTPATPTPTPPTKPKAPAKPKKATPPPKKPKIKTKAPEDMNKKELDELDEKERAKAALPPDATEADIDKTVEAAKKVRKDLQDQVDDPKPETSLDKLEKLGRGSVRLKNAKLKIRRKVLQKELTQPAVIGVDAKGEVKIVKSPKPTAAFALSTLDPEHKEGRDVALQMTLAKAEAKKQGLEPIGRDYPTGFAIGDQFASAIKSAKDIGLKKKAKAAKRQRKESTERAALISGNPGVFVKKGTGVVVEVKLADGKTETLTTTTGKPFANEKSAGAAAKRANVYMPENVKLQPFQRKFFKDKVEPKMHIFRNAAKKFANKTGGTRTVIEKTRVSKLKGKVVADIESFADFAVVEQLSKITQADIDGGKAIGKIVTGVRESMKNHARENWLVKLPRREADAIINAGQSRAVFDALDEEIEEIEGEDMSKHELIGEVPADLAKASGTKATKAATGVVKARPVYSKGKAKTKAEKKGADEDAARIAPSKVKTLTPAEIKAVTEKGKKEDARVDKAMREESDRVNKELAQQKKKAEGAAVKIADLKRTANTASAYNLGGESKAQEAQATSDAVDILNNQSGQANVIMDASAAGVKAIKSLISVLKSGKKTVAWAGKTFGVEYPWVQMGADTSGRAFKNLMSARAAEQIRGIQEARAVIRELKKSFGDKLTQDQMIDAVFATEDPAYMKSLDPDYAKKLKKATQLMANFFNTRRDVYKKRGKPVDFKERVLIGLNERLAKAKLGSKTETNLKERIAQAERLQFVHIPIQVLYERAAQLEFKEGLSPRKRTSLKGVMNLLAEKKRTVLRLQDVYKGLENQAENGKTEKKRQEAKDQLTTIKELINPASVMVNYAHRYAKDMALLDVVNSLEHDGLAKKVKEGDETPEGWIELKNPNENGVLAGYFIEDKAFEAIKAAQTIDLMQDKWGRFMAMTKMMAFYNPVFLPMYDAVQSVWSGAHFQLDPTKSLVSATEAVKHTKAMDDVYIEAMKAGLFSKPFDMPFATMRDTMDELVKATKGKGGAAETVAQIAFWGVRNSKFSKHNLIGPLNALYHGSWAAAWKMDETVRMMTYLQLRKKGMTVVEAAQVAAKFHGDYASVPAKTRRLLNRIFFTPTFKIVMAKTYASMVKNTVMMPLDLARGKSTATQRQLAMGLVGLTLVNAVFDAFMKAHGFEADDDKWYNWGRKYSQVIDTQYGPQEIVFTWSNPTNLLQRYISRLATAGRKNNDPTNIIWDTIKWDVHPVFVAMLSAKANRRPDGSNVYGTYDTATVKALKTVSFLLTSLIKVGENPAEFLESKLTGDAKSWKQRETSRYINNTFGAISKVFFGEGLLGKTFGVSSAYLRDVDAKRFKYDINRKKIQLKGEQKRYFINNGHLNEPWLKEFRRIVEKEQKRMERK